MTNIKIVNLEERKADVITDEKPLKCFIWHNMRLETDRYREERGMEPIIGKVPEGLESYYKKVVTDGEPIGCCEMEGDMLSLFLTALEGYISHDKKIMKILDNITNAIEKEATMDE